ncbi:hypothetical protein [Lysobacter sp. M15]|uniref:hypothetical protein n=1 Tax=Lysobacter sp. M15 TaxID=2916837 RepID=UPI001F56BCDD|nr:hypothetical protein [Lysobacter sp. M15]
MKDPMTPYKRILILEAGVIVFLGLVFAFLRAKGISGAAEFCFWVFVVLQAVILLPPLVVALRKGRRG